MISALEIANVPRHTIGSDEKLRTQIGDLIRLAADLPSLLDPKTFYVPLGSTLLCAFDVAEPERTPIGAALINFGVKSSNCHLEAIAVSPHYQRQQLGIGTKILGAAFTLAQSRERSVMTLITAQHSPWLIKYYERHGFFHDEVDGRSNRRLRKIINSKEESTVKHLAV